MSMLAADAPARQNEAPTAEVLKLLKDEDSCKAIEFIQSLGEPAKVAEAYSNLVQGLYEKKNVAAMITIGRAGVQFCLTIAQQLAKSDEKKSAWFRQNAQVMSFNLAANCWPGWGEEGIVLSPADLAFGFDMARLDLRLATEMKYPLLKLSNSNWIAGAHCMAAGKYADALAWFGKSRQHAEEAKAADQAEMVKGYAGITEILAGKEEGKAHFAAALEKLKASKGEDAKFFADQIQSVLKVFTGK
ncbi:MAG TPA: hypothetical protein VGP72_21710 [Planctomycetota bacterium]